MKMKIKCSHSEIVDIDSLVPHPRNPNEHPEQQIEMLAKIINHQGWRSPIVVSNRSGFITKGHGRLLAARYMGWEEVPIDRQDYDSEAQEYADIVADNKIAELAAMNMIMVNEDALKLGEGFDFDLLGIPDFAPVQIEELDPQCGEDEVPEHVEPKCKLGDIYQLGKHRLMCGDSTSITAVELLMDGEKAELCFTSPPYSDQREYNGGKELSTEHLAKFISTSIGFVDYYAVNLGYSRKNGEVYSYWDDYTKEAKDCGLKFLSWNIWDRGSAFSIGQQTAMFPIEHEWIFVFGKNTKDLNLTVKNKFAGEKTGITNRQADGTLKRKESSEIREHRPLGTIVRCGVDRNRSINHPAKFPVEFVESYVLSMTNVGEAIYEPFGGSGTTLIACEKTNRKCFMMELDPHYCDVIIARWEKFTGKTSTRVNPKETR